MYYISRTLGIQVVERVAFLPVVEGMSLAALELDVINLTTSQINQATPSEPGHNSNIEIGESRLPSGTVIKVYRPPPKKPRDPLKTPFQWLTLQPKNHATALINPTRPAMGRRLLGLLAGGLVPPGSYLTSQKTRLAILTLTQINHATAALTPVSPANARHQPVLPPGGLSGINRPTQSKVVVCRTLVQ